ncbi:MAG TPA: hypothetical protein VJS92_05960, partial [Candidatus Polarisedimenticolaceae bacterium]|nr:hypothetical protein [Candidatus Polarisedimenticolaceae bacterium]
PARRAFLDGRIDLLAPMNYLLYADALRDPQLFEQLVQRYRVTHVILRYGPEEVWPLLQWLEGGGAWRRAWYDGTAAVYLRADDLAATVGPVPSREHPLDGWARSSFAPLRAWQRRLPIEELNQAFLAQVAGDLDEALRHYDAALAELPGFDRARQARRTLLGALAAQRPDDPEIQRRWQESQAEPP